ncbi:MAG: aminotransferase class IV [Acidobacteria bacterium]|nr:aminotransferase class IV [Acidobacteriota bacterium]
MPDILYFNGRFTTTDEAVISVEDRGLQFGDSLYEVIRFIDGAPRFARAHWERMDRGLRALRIPDPWSGWPEFGGMLGQILDKTEFDEGILYIQVTRGVSERSHFYIDQMQPTSIAYSRRFDFPDELQRRRGVSAVTFEDIRWKRCDIKSVNLLPNVLAKTHAKQSGAGEAILLGDGIVTEGASSNLFVVSGERLITHPPNVHILPGIVRDRVIEIAIEQKIRLDERPVQQTELFSIDEVFLTSTTQGVMPIISIDGRPVGTGSIGTVTARVQRLFEALERSDRAVDAIDAS